MNINRILRRVIYACLACTVVLPLAPIVTVYTTFSMFFPYITPGAFLFRIVALTAFGAWVILCLRDKAYRPRLNAISISMIAFIAIVLVADLFGVDRIRSIWSNFERMEGFMTWSHLIMLFFVVSHTIRFKSQWAIIASSSWGIAIISSLIAITQYDGYDDNRISGVFGNPIYFAIYSLIHVYIALYALYQYYKEGKLNSFKGWVVSGSIVLFVIGIIMSGTRGTFVALGASLFVSAIILAIKEKSDKKIRFVSLGLIGFVIATTAFLFFARNVPSLTQYSFISRASSVFDMRHNTVFARFNNWQIAWDAFKDRPVLGWGQDNYIYPFASHHNPKMFLQEPWFDRTHNVILDWLIAAGVLGLLAYLSILVSIVVAVFRSKKMSAGEQAFIIGVLSGYFVHNIFVFDYLLSAVALMLIAAYVHSRSDIVQARSNPKDKSLESGEYLAVGCVAVATVAGVYFLNIPAIGNAINLSDAVSTQNVNQKLSMFEELVNSNVIGRTEIIEQFVVASAQITRASNIPDDVKNKFQESAGKAIVREAEAHPNNVRTLTFLGSHLLTNGKYEEGVKVFEKARAIAPRRQANLLTLSTAYSLAGRPVDAINTARQAFLLEKNNHAARIALIKLLIGNGNIEEAEKLILPEDKKNPESRQALISGYLQAKSYQKIIDILKPIVAENPSNIQDAISLSVSYLENGQRTESVNVLIELKKHVNDPAIISDLDSFIASIRAGKNPIVE